MESLPLIVPRELGRPMNVLELKLRLYSAMKAEIEVCQADAGRNLETLAECLESLSRIEELSRSEHSISEADQSQVQKLLELVEMQQRYRDHVSPAEPCTEPPQRARLLPYLRTIAALAWSAFRHPTKTTVIDWSTGRVIGHYDSGAAA